jgi:hypothetical protein
MSSSDSLATFPYLEIRKSVVLAGGNIKESLQEG